jgi:serine/threonine protein kinase
MHAVAAAPALEEPRLAGELIGRYRLGERIGRGGFGVVYDAVDTELGRPVAVKLMRARDQVRAASFKREAMLVARLNHPNVVTLHDYGVDENTPFLVLERLRGEPLDQRIRRAPVEPGVAIDIAIEVARALEHAHAEGVVHADLKPANVFLCESGVVKVLDFGLGRLDGARDCDSGEGGGGGGGTPAYMAPERFLGERSSPASDVFAIGVMLYELITGALPLRDGGHDLLDGTAAPSLEGALLPDGLAGVVARALARDPAARFASAEELRVALAVVRRRTLEPERPRRRRLLWLALVACLAGCVVDFAQRPIEAARADAASSVCANELPRLLPAGARSTLASITGDGG